EQIGEARPGFYTVRLVRGGLSVPVKIWFGRPIIDGEEQDRSPRLCIEVDGRTCRPEIDETTGERIGRVPLDPIYDDIWPSCRPISEREYLFMRRRSAWAREHAPDHPAADPRKPVDLRRMKPLW